MASFFPDMVYIVHSSVDKATLFTNKGSQYWDTRVTTAFSTWFECFYESAITRL